MEKKISVLPLGELIAQYPICQDFLNSYRLADLDRTKPLPASIAESKPESMEELGLSALDIVDLLVELITQSDGAAMKSIKSIEIIGGTDKGGKPENIIIPIQIGEVVSIVGPTGSGKSQLLADIECVAKGDTPSGRVIRFDGKELPDEKRFSFGNRLVAQLTQNMNFVIDVSVEEFLRMHAQSRWTDEPSELIERCFAAANALSGEPFDKDTKVTRLSGGQSRALMIADAACISPSPILLIDEIENAGIDRINAINLLSGGEKIVLLATHDPLLALSAMKRITLCNGGILSVLERSEKERKNLEQLIAMDRQQSQLRETMRRGERMEQNVENV